LQGELITPTAAPVQASKAVESIPAAMSAPIPTPPALASASQAIQLEEESDLEGETDDYQEAARQDCEKMAIAWD